MKIQKAGYVYFIRCGEFVKVGKAKRPRKRLEECQIGNPHTLELIGAKASNDMLSDESELHNKYAAYRVRGEWFKIPQDVLSQDLKHLNHDILAEDRIIKVQIKITSELWRRTKAVAALNKITLSNFISQSVRAALIRCEQIKAPTTPTRKD